MAISSSVRAQQTISASTAYIGSYANMGKGHPMDTQLGRKWIERMYGDYSRGKDLQIALSNQIRHVSAHDQQHTPEAEWEGATKSTGHNWQGFGSA